MRKTNACSAGYPACAKVKFFQGLYFSGEGALGLASIVKILLLRTLYRYFLRSRLKFRFFCMQVLYALSLPSRRRFFLGRRGKFRGRAHTRVSLARYIKLNQKNQPATATQTVRPYRCSQLSVACFRLRDSGEKTFSKKKCKKSAGAGEEQGDTSPLYYLRAWYRLNLVQ